VEKECLLFERTCINCGECSVCDLDRNKKCDNCEMCIANDGSFKTLRIKDFMTIQENENRGQAT
jgi:hypothetical protein